MQQTKQIALITGANKGIGFEIARQLGELGIVVLVGARDQERGEAAVKKIQAEGGEAIAVHLDVTRQDTINATASYIDTTYDKLDILVNNAAISLPAGRVLPGELDIDAFRAIYEANVFGAFAMTKAMLPPLKRSEAGRIVNMSSNMGSLSLFSDPESFFAKMSPLLAYNSSKTALNAITVAFANELRATAIKINSVSPGYCATDINDHQGFLTPQEGAKIAVRFATLPDDGPTGRFFEEQGNIPW